MTVTGRPVTTILPGAEQQLPDDVGTAGPLGLLLTLLLLIAVLLLVRSMTRHLKRLPPTFDDDDDRVSQIPDTPADLVEPRTPGDDVLDALRREPRAIEPPRRRDDGHPGSREP